MYLVLSMSLFIFMYKIYYGRYYKRIGYNMNQHSPVADFYRNLMTIYCFPALFFDNDDVSNAHYSICATMIILSYNIIDSTYYKHGGTNKAWIIHHIITILASLCGLFCNIKIVFCSGLTFGDSFVYLFLSKK